MIDNLFSLLKIKIFWRFLPNVYDITMLHNQTAFFMGEISALRDYTPRFQYVDLMFNGRYTGTYMLGEFLDVVGADDIDIMVDWYLINEIAKNEKGAFWSNCIMNYERGGKLKMGPIWEFETAFGNAGHSCRA